VVGLCVELGAALGARSSTSGYEEKRLETDHWTGAT